MSAPALVMPPAGWLDCEPAMGDPIGSTNIILMKAPISPRKYRLPKTAFTPEEFLRQAHVVGRKVSYVVEVSVRTPEDGAGQTVTTSAYYDPEIDFKPQGVRYIHFKVDLCTTPATSTDPTKQPCPIEPQSINAFVLLMRGLVAITDSKTVKEEVDNSSTGAAAAASSTSASLPCFIYVHDLYGFNLPGFLLTCYLIDDCGMDWNTAMNDIGDARPPGIYIASLNQAIINRYFQQDLIENGMDLSTPTPIVGEYPKPDHHQIPWTNILPKPVDPSSTENGPTTPAVGEETFKRKARKKAPLPPAPTFSQAAAASSSAIPSIASATAVAATSTVGVKRPNTDHITNGIKTEEPSAKRPKPEASTTPSIFPSVTTSTSSSSFPTSSSIPPLDVSRLRSDHLFLPRQLDAHAILKSDSVLQSLLPPTEIAALKCGPSIWSLLQPPPITPNTLQQLQRQGPSAPYSLSWLPHHYPCFLLILRAEVYLIFSETVWFRVPDLHFPKRTNPTEDVNNTLLLGELVVDPITDPGSTSATPIVTYQSRLLTTDLLVMSRTILGHHLTHEKRLQTLETELIQPLKQLREKLKQPIHLHIRNKMMFPLQKIDSVRHMKVGHGNLGLVIQMNGKVETPNEGYKFIWKKDEPNGVRSEQLQFTTTKQ